MLESLVKLFSLATKSKRKLYTASGLGYTLILVSSLLSIPLKVKESGVPETSPEM